VTAYRRSITTTIYNTKNAKDKNAKENITKWKKKKKKKKKNLFITNKHTHQT